MTAEKVCLTDVVVDAAISLVADVPATLSPADVSVSVVVLQWTRAFIHIARIVCAAGHHHHHHHHHHCFLVYSWFIGFSPFCIAINFDFVLCTATYCCFITGDACTFDMCN